ncbi:uncharacterized protein GGS25DRAFT_160234 [Hypoxylon fragiforme]|uniref:uncharacterized protein n=1 Tax=Hypoxylon fragiforme TaxID=63214 RepID=UPI0020C5E203|nr:uncharacterized protein GGS25DRAFT_160234 [Hypoxylon fragiforme]KAI2610706.1 hypothetical protein GGS25DRAFT_160234 [Hypoxylon fragiforme]
MDQSQARRRRRDGSSGAQQRLCTHCGRNFKRSEHLERHVRTHTKEKPYVCHCGSAYSRRDLLTRHQRITHETLSPRSPDAPASEDSHQLGATDSDPPSEDAAASSSTASIPDLTMNHDIQQQTQYSTGGHDFSIHNHAVSQQPYNQLITGQGFYDGQNYSGFEHPFQELHNFSDGPGLPPEWSPYYHDPNLEQDLVDPALRGSMIDVSSPLSNENFPSHTYNPWVSSAAQKWGN